MTSAMFATLLTTMISFSFILNKLVYYEIYEDVRRAISREKNIKKWKREWKINIIKKDNPKWIDLYEEMVE